NTARPSAPRAGVLPVSAAAGTGPSSHWRSCSVAWGAPSTADAATAAQAASVITLTRTCASKRDFSIEAMRPSSGFQPQRIRTRYRAREATPQTQRLFVLIGSVVARLERQRADMR